MGPADRLILRSSEFSKLTMLRSLSSWLELLLELLEELWRLLLSWESI